MRGFGLIEALLTLSMVATLIMLFVGTIVYEQQVARAAMLRTQALLVANEGLEAVHNMGEKDFALLTDGVHGLTLSGGPEGGWTFMGEEEQVDSFFRQISINPIDAADKEVTVTVRWDGGHGPSHISLSTYVSNWK